MDKRKFLRYADAYSYEYAQAVKSLPSYKASVIVWVITLALACFMTWSFICRIDETAMAVGVIVPGMDVRAIKSIVAGNIVKVSVQNGQYVKKGGVLAQIDQSTDQNRLQSLIENREGERKVLAGLQEQYRAQLSLVENGFVSRTALLQFEEKLHQSESRFRSLNAEIRAQENVVRKLTIQAPHSGYVYNMKMSDGPVQEGEELLSIIPPDRGLIFQAKVSNQDAGFIKQGQPVKIKLDAFPYQQFGLLEGHIELISQNAVKDERAQDVWNYVVTIALDTNRIAVNGKTPSLIPGMTGLIEMRVRDKRLIDFIIEPISRTVGEGLSVR